MSSRTSVEMEDGVNLASAHSQSSITLVIEASLSIVKVLLGGDDITVKSWSEVVIDVLGWILPLGF